VDFCGRGVVLTIRALLDSSAGGVVTHTALQVLRHPVIVAGVDLSAGYGARTAHGARFVRRRGARVPKSYARNARAARWIRVRVQPFRSLGFLASSARFPVAVAR